MSSLIVFNFDGTGNEPADANSQDDNSISNILKLHLLLGGNLFDDTDLRGLSDNTNIQRSFYYQGVGTYGNRLRRIINQGLALENLDVATIINKAKHDFENSYACGDTLLITGFSRGAAIARRFASIIATSLISQGTEPFIFLCAFDTVASIGLPNLSNRSRPGYDVVFENGATLSPLIKKALHLVSIDDKRRAFQPTLMNHEPEKTFEIWFAGAHSDIGGGFAEDGLSDITLQFTMDWLIQMNQESEFPFIEFKNLTSDIINDACPDRLKNVINRDDVTIEPDSMGICHQQDRWPLLDLMTLDDRVCCVMQNDQIKTDKLPVVHLSIVERLANDESYQPNSLESTAHHVWYDFHTPFNQFKNAQAHRVSD